VDQASGEGGAAVRTRAAGALSPFVTWRTLPRLALTAAALVVALTARAVASLFRRRRQQRRRRTLASLPGLRSGLDVMGVHLSCAALKRARLVAVLSFARLWAQSHRKAIASVLMAAAIFWRALMTRVALGTHDSSGRAAHTW
jgi:hypothetical protein